MPAFTVWWVGNSTDAPWKVYLAAGGAIALGVLTGNPAYIGVDLLLAVAGLYVGLKTQSTRKAKRHAAREQVGYLLSIEDTLNGAVTLIERKQVALSLMTKDFFSDAERQAVQSEISWLQQCQAMDEARELRKEKLALLKAKALAENAKGLDASQ